MKFDKKIEKCSKVAKTSCGTRDCNLEVYRLGNEIIYSGGLCPKGNTGAISKKAPDYVRIYLGILEKHLARVSGPIEDSNGCGRILIPRSLTFLNEKGVFYCSFYKNLGFEVCVSPESNEEISNLGKSHSHSEFCFPLILSHGHAAYLKEKMKKDDKLLLVDAIGCGNEKFKFCPYVAASGNLIAGNLGLKKEDILIPVLHFNDKHYPIHEDLYLDLKRVFGTRFSKKQVLSSVLKAKENEKAFLDEAYKKGDEILKELKARGEKIFLGIGRGYTIFDRKASSDVNELFVSNGLHFIPSYFLNLSRYNVDDIVENMYWYQGRKMLEQTWFAFEDKNIFPIRLTNFNCGPDSIIYFHEEKLANQHNKPWLVLETDGHNSNAQFGTRIQAHNRVVEKYFENPASSDFKLGKNSGQNFKGKIIGIPYMGDSSDLMAGALRGMGYDACVMPTGTPEAAAIAKKLAVTNTCRPFSFQIGDHLAWLESLNKKGIDANLRAVVLMPTTKGPCRFGQYSVIIRKFLEENGFSGVNVISPNSAKDYNDIELPQLKKIRLVSLFFRLNLANEILKSCLFRARPYEINKGDCDRVYSNAHKELIELAEKKPSLDQIYAFLLKKLKEFKDIKRNDEKRFPLVLVDGEIFIRCHEISNYDSVKLLESYGLEVILDPVYSWIDYVNKNTIQKSIQRKNISLLVMSLIKKVYINKIAKKLFDPFKDFLKGREFHNIFHLIKTIENDLVFNSAIEGESPVSIGTAYSFIKGEMQIDGIYHVGPLGCMQETVATSRIQALVNEQRSLKDGKKIIPILDAVFGESAIPNLDSQMAIFAENCRLHKEIRDKA